MKTNKTLILSFMLLFAIGCNSIDTHIISSPDGDKHVTLIRERIIASQNDSYRAYLVYGIYNKNYTPKNDYVEIGFDLGYTNLLINWKKDTVMVFNAKVFDDRQEGVKMKLLYSETSSESDSIKRLYDIKSPKWIGYESVNIIKNKYSKVQN